MTDEYQPFLRVDLLNFAPDDERQALAWDRLRRVCIELRLKVPTMMQVREIDSDLSGEILATFKARYSPDGELFDEELQRFVICEPEDGEGQIFVQFDAGYRME
jgi:hypothetical protein